MTMIEPSDDTAAIPAADLSHLTGAQKAAIVLLKLGSDRASSILRLLGDREVTRITTEIAKAGAIPAAEADASLLELAQRARAGELGAAGGVSQARRMLEAAVGAERADAIMGTLPISTAKEPFEFIATTEPRQVVNFLGNEHPQTVAVVLAHLPPDRASAILGGLEEDMRRDVSIRIARLEQTSPEVIAQLEEMLEQRFGAARAGRSPLDRADGIQTLIDILNRSDRATERSIFEGLEESEAELADNVRKRMFVFEDIVGLDDRAVQLILRSIETKDLATALKGVKPAVKEKVMGNMSERAAKNLDEEIMLLGQVRLSTVEESQSKIVQEIRSLEESGQIMVSRGSEEFVE